MTNFTKEEEELAKWLHRKVQIDYCHLPNGIESQKWLLLARELQKKMVDRTKVFGVDVEDMARMFHKTYEEQAIMCNWKTQKSCHSNYDGLPPENRATMERTCAIIIDWISKNNEEHKLHFLKIEPSRESGLVGVDAQEASVATEDESSKVDSVDRSASVATHKKVKE